jgi:uncharacterized protein (DUF2267 family)
MKYRELIKKVQNYSGFSDTESKEALEMMVESLAVHLNEGERKDFASQLPPDGCLFTLGGKLWFSNF